MHAGNADIVASANASLIGNYARLPVAMLRGRGSYLWDADGKQYIDLFAGFGGCILGHCHPDLVAEAKGQIDLLWHVGNQFHTQPQVDLADRIRSRAFDGRAFFCHSGLEANEAAVKLARLRGHANGGKKWKTISLYKSFHGRSLAMIAATGNPQVKEGFGPTVPGFINVDPMDLHAISSAIDDETCAILMEPVQGEGGVNFYPPGHLAAVRKLCDDNALTLIFDEVWTGVGRTGKWFAHQWGDSLADDSDLKPVGVGVTPDIMTLGKALGGGLPLAAMYARPELAALMVPGKHGCTLGGNPVTTSVGKRIFDVIERDKLLAHAAAMGQAIENRIRNEPKLASRIANVRGLGLFVGIELVDVINDLVPRFTANGVIANVTASKVIRLAPALNISPDVLHAGLDRVIQTLVAA